MSGHHHNPIFDQYLGRGYPSGGQGEFRYVCPFCHEKDRTFAVNFVRKRFICFRGSCAQAGSLAYLARKLGFAYDDNAPVLSSVDQLRHRLSFVDDEEGLSDIAPKISEPVAIPELHQIHPGCYAWDYLINRQLTPDDIYFNQLSLSPEDRGQRIYFPHRDDNGRVIYWVARLYLPGSRGRKYKNPTGGIKRMLLYRSNLIDRNYPVSVCEGPISAIVAGNAVATLGVRYSKEQVELISRLGAPVLSAMDGEAFSKSLKLAKELEQVGTDVSVVPLPSGTDPATVGRAEYYRYVGMAFRVEPGAVTDVRERLGRVW